MEEGDFFYIHVLGKTLAYKVDQIKVVLPEETDDIKIVEGKDYVTLLTCTPYGVNSHRLLVRGERTDYVPDTVSVEPSSKVQAKEMIPVSTIMMTGMIAGIAIVIVILLLILFMPGKDQKRGKE